jgi:hypothetical protein
MAEQQLHLIVENAVRGGARSGAGRKSKRFGAPERPETSKVLRVPLMYCDAAKRPIIALDVCTAGEVGTSEDVEMHITPYRADLAALELLISVKREV